MKALRFIALLGFVIIFSGISSVNFYSQEQKPNDVTKQVVQTKVVENNGSDSATQKNKVKIQSQDYEKNNERYRIGFKDILDIKVYRHPELNQTVSVNPDGTINLYRIDNPVVAVCKTEKELSDLIATLYQNFLRKPFINVRAVEQKSQPLAVIGAVKKPGVFYLNNKVRLIQLLSMAEGHDVEFAGSKVQIARIGNQSGCRNTDNGSASPDVEFLSFNLFEILKGRQNPWVQPGDIVSVLEAEEAYVVGNVVNEAEKISLKEPITLTQAIAKAGGVNNTAKTSKVRIQRQKAGTPLRTTLIFDLKEIRENKVEDPILQPNDIVEVPTDKLKSARNSFIKALTGGIGNIFYRFPL